MLPEKWKDVLGTIKDTFEVADLGALELDDEGGITIEYIEFQSPLGKTRLEFIKKPVILDRVTNYSNRIGSETQVKYVYSKDEFSHTMIAYKWDEVDGDWEEIDGGMFA